MGAEAYGRSIQVGWPRGWKRRGRNIGEHMGIGMGLRLALIASGPAFAATVTADFGAYGGYVNMMPKWARRNPVNKVEVSVGTDSFMSGMIDVGQELLDNDQLQVRVVLGNLDYERPGFTDTEMVGAAVTRLVAKSGRSEDEARSALTTFNPQRRLIRPEEVAATTVWLCQPDSAALTGQTISISGGETP